ncbi:peptide ABC transporter substrate-binding protein [Microbacterium amylolyticum]|uniref:Oligopeptide transport system substrate-binding protein n=1 Tax=Microbacterium amylolyticum TaxID=936337 RepID=A0ABS4ZL50_9MICO|nr:ABC transporter substrate-binding protein [Microbacterium amylolyticum]MBP2437748.1 oligopeptide transport system substrate-binding protein [Microbacterium amylolyticum]
MKRNKIALSGLALAGVVSLTLAGCASGAGNNDADGDIIRVNGTEPQVGLFSTDTNEVGGGKIVDSIFSGLITYEADGTTVLDVAEDISIDSDNQLTVTIREGLEFTNGEEITADNFINAWNYGAALDNEQRQAYFYSYIAGYSAEENVDELSGLEQIDDHTFTITTEGTPAADFAERLGYSAYYPMPDVAFEDMAAFGENPVGNGPYMLAEEGAWQHNVQIDLVANPSYDGPRTPKNDGLRIVFYANEEAAYADLQAGNLDILDNVPQSMFSVYEDDFPGRTVNMGTALNQTITIPGWLEHFSGGEGQLRRQAISMAIDREEIADVIFHGSRLPMVDFSSPVVEGWSDEIEGNEVLSFNPEKAAELWAQADEIAPFSGSFKIGYNADSSHEAWVEAVANQLRTNLEIDASGDAYPTFAEFRSQITAGQIDSAFRTGWQADYPGLYNFLGPLFATGASSNDGKFSSEAFDGLLSEGLEFVGVDNIAAAEKFNEAQSVLLAELPAIPLFYQNAVGAWTENVENVEFAWNSVPVYTEVTVAP